MYQALVAMHCFGQILGIVMVKMTSEESVSSPIVNVHFVGESIRFEVNLIEQVHRWAHRGPPVSGAVPGKVVLTQWRLVADALNDEFGSVGYDLLGELGLQ